jgi:predicted MFS family arabinose efflux permease
MAAVTPPVRLRTTALAIGAMFAVNGFAFGSWVPRLPEVRDALDVGDAALGLTLLGGGIGGLAMSLASGPLVDRFGSRRTMVATSLALSCLLPLIALAPSPPALFAVLLAVGALDGVTDVAQNAQGIELQAKVRRSMLTRLHAAWSLGTLSGGLVASRSAAADVSFTLQLSLTAVLLAVVCALAAPRLLPSTARHTAATAAEVPTVRGWARPHGWLLFGMGAAAVLAELPPTEWAALVMAQRFDLATGAAGLGFVAFTAGMVVGRLSGDEVVDRIGPEPTRRGGAVLALAGIVVLGLSPSQWVAAAGLAVVGLGASSLFPLAVRRAGELDGSRGVALFSSGARAGMLLGSPAMGLVSEATSRTTALLLVSGTAALVSAAVRLPPAPVAPGSVPRR